LPEQLPFIGYPAEWSPAQLKAAALLTLEILTLAIDKGMILKDASPLNVQFREGRPCSSTPCPSSDTIPPGPWVAYRQFCECFLFSLYLHHYHHQGIHKTMIRLAGGYSGTGHAAAAAAQEPAAAGGMAACRPARPAPQPQRWREGFRQYQQDSVLR